MKKLLFALFALCVAVPLWADGLVTRGDANDDGSVNPADISALINHLLNGAAVNEFAADVDLDGTISPADISTLINYLLNGVMPAGPDVFAVNGVGFKMMPVDGGTFMMGQEGVSVPVHEVTLSSYRIGQTAVTQALWLAVMGDNPSRYTGDLQRPVEYVTWNDCQTFIAKLNLMTGQRFRLLTEAEWEFAARGGNRSMSNTYAGSENIDDVAWYSGNSGGETHPVATKAPNELGLYDMSGNQWEWCQDYWGSYSADAQTNPTGGATSTYRVTRGGSCHDGASGCTVYKRGYSGQTYRDNHLGLRLALDDANAPVVTTSMSDDYMTVTASGEGTVMLYVNGQLVRNPHTVSRGTVAYTISAYATSQEEGRELKYSSKQRFTVLPVGVTSQEIEVNGARFTMLGIGGGTFMMGGTEEQGTDAQSNEKPAHQVTLTGYSIAQTEVTQELWLAVMGTAPAYWAGDYTRPIENVSWNDCQAFIAQLNELTGMNFRLPTEAEWEYAARGGSLSQGYKYAGSNTLDDVAWYTANGGGSTHAVGIKAPNELGLFDMSGNVWEFCQDYYGTYTADPQTNPTGPATGNSRVLHGAAYPNTAIDCRVPVRHSESMTFKARDVGFRIAL